MVAAPQLRLTSTGLIAEGTSGPQLLLGFLDSLLRWRVPALTAPFVFTTLCFVLACARFSRLHSTHLLPTAGLPKAAAAEGIVTMSTAAETTCRIGRGIAIGSHCYDDCILIHRLDSQHAAARGADSGWRYADTRVGGNRSDTMCSNGAFAIDVRCLGAWDI